MLPSIDTAKKAVDTARAAWLQAVANTHVAHEFRALVGPDLGAERVRAAWAVEERCHDVYETCRAGLHAVARDNPTPRVVDSLREVVDVSCEACATLAFTAFGMAVVKSIVAPFVEGGDA